MTSTLQCFAWHCNTKVHTVSDGHWGVNFLIGWSSFALKKRQYLIIFFCVDINCLIGVMLGNAIIYENKYFIPARPTQFRIKALQNCTGS